MKQSLWKVGERGEIYDSGQHEDPFEVSDHEFKMRPVSTIIFFSSHGLPHMTGRKWGESWIYRELQFCQAKAMK